MPKERSRPKPAPAKLPAGIKNKITNDEVDIADLVPYEKNARLHPEKQIEKLMESIKRFGFVHPLSVWKGNELIGGHGRLIAAKRLYDTKDPAFAYLKKLPVRRCDHLSNSERKALALFENRIVEDSGWDKDILKAEITNISVEDPDLISLTGFDDKEIVIKEAKLDIDRDDDVLPATPTTAKTKRGDIIILGEHRLMCGDSTDIKQVQELLAGNKVDVCFTDPPYGIDFNVENGKVAKGTYRKVEGDGDIEIAEKVFMLVQRLKIQYQFFWGANHYSHVLPGSPCWIVWDKQDGKSVSYADCELCYTNMTKSAKMFKHIWDGFRRESERGIKRVHPTQKPVKLIEDIFDRFKLPKRVVDLCGGSGSTLIACENTKRRCFMMEIDPLYCDVIVKRWEEHTGKQAVRQKSQ